MTRLLTRNPVLVTLCAVLSLTAIYWQGRAAGGGATGERISVGALESPRPENAFEAGNAVALVEHMGTLTITEIRNLYRADNTYQHGYTSSDFKGRIYTNREWGPDNPTTMPTATPTTIPWAPHQNYIELTVEYEGPAEGAWVYWQYDDPDDPTNNQADWNVKYAWRIDPNDCDNYHPVRQAPADNLTTQPATQRWQQLNPYTLGEDEYGFYTPLLEVGGKRLSRVRLNVDPIAGFNYIVHAAVFDDEGTMLGLTQSGIMTVWHMIYLEVGRMPGASGSIDLDFVNQHFAPACITFIQPWLPTTRVTDKAYFEPDAQDLKDGISEEDSIYHAQIEYCKKEAQHAGPGVFFLVEGRRSSPPRPAPATQVIWPPPEVAPTTRRCDQWAFTEQACHDYGMTALHAKILRPTTREVAVEVRGPSGVLLASGNTSIDTEGDCGVVHFAGLSNCQGTVRVWRFDDEVGTDFDLDVMPRESKSVTLPTGQGDPLTLTPPPTTRPGQLSEPRLYPETLRILHPGTSSWWNDWSLGPRDVCGDQLTIVTRDKWYGLDDPNHAFHKDLMDYLEPADTRRTGTHTYDVQLLSEGDWIFWGMTMADWASYIPDTASPDVHGPLLFTGRCIIFTDGQSPFQCSATAVHELAHCLGLAHNCGNKDWRSATPRAACVMQYFSYFPLASGDDVWQPQHPFSSTRPVIPWPSYLNFDVASAFRFCAEHLQALRQVQLCDDGTTRLLGWGPLP